MDEKLKRDIIKADDEFNEAVIHLLNTIDRLYSNGDRMPEELREAKNDVAIKGAMLALHNLMAF